MVSFRVVYGCLLALSAPIRQSRYDADYAPEYQTQPASGSNVPPLRARVYNFQRSPFFVQRYCSPAGSGDSTFTAAHVVGCNWRLPLFCRRIHSPIRDRPLLANNTIVTRWARIPNWKAIRSLTTPTTFSFECHRSSFFAAAYKLARLSRNFRVFLVIAR